MKLFRIQISTGGEIVQLQTIRRCLMLSAMGIMIGTSSTPLFAQQPKNQFQSGVANRRTVSPWISTIDNTGQGLSPLNYYNIVTPQRRFAAAAQNLQNEVQTLQSSSRNSNNAMTSTSSMPITSGRMSPTGHATSFGDTRGYFRGGGGGGNGGGGNGGGGNGGGGGGGRGRR